MQNKGQMEVFGLVIIVLLLSVGILVALSLVLKSGPSTLKQDYDDLRLANNMINTMLNTNIPTSQYLTIQELIVLCRADDRSKVPDPCGDAHGAIENILRETLEAWHRDYQFIAQDSAGNIVTDGFTELKITSAGLTNPEALPKKSRVYPIPAAEGNIDIRLMIFK